MLLHQQLKVSSCEKASVFWRNRISILPKIIDPLQLVPNDIYHDIILTLIYPNIENRTQWYDNNEINQK